MKNNHAITVFLMLLAGAMVLTPNVASAQNWTQTSAPTNKAWNAVACSADGNRVIALISSLAYYTSTNSGGNWDSNGIPGTGSVFGDSIASSADGNILVALSGSSTWVSTNSGKSWLSNNVAGVSSWMSLASSADGTKLVAVDGGNNSGFIYTSTNTGATWIKTSAPSNHWISVASSADGTRLLAASFTQYNSQFVRISDGCIFTSTNSGDSWIQTYAPTCNWSSVACSADGLKLVAARKPEWNFVGGNFVWLSQGAIYTSADSGATWVSNNVPTNPWQTIIASADGSKLAALRQDGAIYTSTNFGAIWTSNSVTASPCWTMASSADGEKLIMAVRDGGIYTSQTTPSPQLNLTLLPANCSLAWTIPSTNFGLQQSTDLAAWADVTNPPVLNLTNLQHQVTICSSNSSSFYRLKTR